jgi:hypothetical protein
MDHIKIDIIDGKLGPWVHLYFPMNKGCGSTDPVDLLLILDDSTRPEWEEYSGPAPDSEEYKAESLDWERRFGLKGR